jgi:hypothetical protein
MGIVMSGRRPGVHVTEVQKVPVSKSLILLHILKYYLQEREISAVLRFSTFLFEPFRLNSGRIGS